MVTAMVEESLNAVFSVGPVQRLYQEDLQASPMPGGTTGLPCSWGKEIQEGGPPGWGSLKNRQ
jgi:hypothetical protein